MAVASWAFVQAAQSLWICSTYVVAVETDFYEPQAQRSMRASVYLEFYCLPSTQG